MIKDIYIGDKVSKGLVFNNKADGSPVNLTNCTIEFALKANKSDASPIISKSITSHTDAVNGLSALLLTSAETALFPEGTVYYKIKLIDASAQKMTIIDDTVKIIKAGAD